MTENLPALSRPWPLTAREAQLRTFDAALGDPHSSGLIIGGPAGVGRTRLAHELMNRAGDAGHRAGRATANAAAATIAFGALAGLLPGSAPDFASARAHLRPGPDGRRYVLVVDDLHLLDAASTVLIGQLVADGEVFLVGTVREGAPNTVAVGALDHPDRITRVALHPFSLAEVERLLVGALGAAVEGHTVRILRDASDGNPLYLRELVLGCLADGRLARRGRLWQLTGAPVPGGRLVELVRARLSTADEREREALELLAVTGPLDVRLALRQCDPHVLERLEERGLIVLRTAETGASVEPAHPLFGEVLRARIPALKRHRLLLGQADLVEGEPGATAGDLMRATTWRLEAGAEVDPAALLSAAATARQAHDYPHCVRLARAALDREDTVGARLLLGEALHLSGRPGEAETVLRAASLLAADDRQRLVVAQLRTQNLFRGALRVTEALAVAREAKAALTDQASRDALAVDEAMICSLTGQPLAALAALEHLDGMPDARSRVMGAIPKATSLIETGSSIAALAVSDRAHREHSGLADAVGTTHPSFHRAPSSYALCELGRFDDALRMAARGYHEAATVGEPLSQAWLAIHQGRAEQLAGRPAASARWFAEAAQVAASHGLAAPQAMALAGEALAYALLGRLADADAALEVLATLPVSPWMRPHIQTAPAWRAAASGDLARAREILLEAADQAQRQDMWTVESYLRSDAARLGGAALVAARLAELAARCEGRLAQLRAEHAAALAARDPHRLGLAADGLAELGAALLAAESASAAGELFRQRDEQRAATAWSVRSAALLESCEGARTPALAGQGGQAPLTRRELEVALLAAQGAASKDIAGRLYLSTRTVDNYLQRVYRKLGVTVRAELPAALGRT